MTMNSLQETLLRWYAAHRRDLPWRASPTPYEVWISEVILQQTRVSQGYDYYLRFKEKWPTVSHLAAATEEEVLKMWQGLGYYSRARNLHRCARQVVERHNARFPADYEALRALQGIGDYTAAAIASIAFGLPHAVVDGNVYRVLARLFDIDTPINNNEGRRTFARLADALLNREQPGLHNQALMEFGALQCVPKSPDCPGCPLQAQCLAFAKHTVAQRPVKLRTTTVATRHFTYLVLRVDDKIYLRRRSGNDIWRNLYDFPCIESDTPLPVEAALTSDALLQLVDRQPFTVASVSPVYTHKLTHRTLIARFIAIKLSHELLHIETKGLILTPERDLGNYPIPRLIDLYLTT